jgi:hypothetical protein
MSPILLPSHGSLYIMTPILSPAHGSSLLSLLNLQL